MVRELIPLWFRRRYREVDPRHQERAVQASLHPPRRIEVSTRRIIAGAVGFSPDFQGERK